MRIIPKQRSEQPNKKSLWSGKEPFDCNCGELSEVSGEVIFSLVWLIKPMTQGKGYEAGF